MRWKLRGGTSESHHGRRCVRARVSKLRAWRRWRRRENAGKVAGEHNALDGDGQLKLCGPLAVVELALMGDPERTCQQHGKLVLAYECVRPRGDPLAVVIARAKARHACVVPLLAALDQKELAPAVARDHPRDHLRVENLCRPRRHLRAQKVQRRPRLAPAWPAIVRLAHVRACLAQDVELLKAHAPRAPCGPVLGPRERRPRPAGWCEERCVNVNASDNCYCPLGIHTPYTTRVC